jgi:PEP-CTERM motif
MRTIPRLTLAVCGQLVCAAPAAATQIDILSTDPNLVGDHFTVIWETELLALNAAKTLHSPFVLTLATDTSVRFLAGEGVGFAETGVDGPAWQDNSGGLSLRISPVPEPLTLALLSAGLGVVGFRARGRRPA